jgi:hypothetical protein
MADLLEQGVRWLEAQRTKHCTRDVTYGRGVDSVVVKATVGRTQYETDDGHAVRVDFTERDFLIQAGDLVLNGNPITPKPGDQIRETQDEQVLVFEVIDWRHSDPYRLTFRIDAKHVATETP